MFAHSWMGISQFCSWVSCGVGIKADGMLTSSQPCVWECCAPNCSNLAQDLLLLPSVPAV